MHIFVHEINELQCICYTINTIASVCILSLGRGYENRCQRDEEGLQKCED